jgi:predicted RNA-binding protein with RPS1 domain
MADSRADDSWKRYGACFAPGSRWLGIVTQLTNFGAFVDLPGHLVGLLHISEMAKEPIDAVEDAVKVGQLVIVTILRADLDDRRIGVSLRQSGGVGAAVKSSPIELKAEWLTENVVALARAIRSAGYRDRGIVAVLADALEEAGCATEGLLDYCRDAQTAVERQGWWVAEAILRASTKPAESGAPPDPAAPNNL